MAELDNELNNPSEDSESQKRIRQLSGKVKEEAEAKAAAEQAKAEAEAKAKEAEQRAAFAEGFADVLSTHPAAKDFKADIQSKVMGGMALEDATFAVLGKAGKLGAPAPEPAPSPAGGSASVAPPQGGAKSPMQMTQEERRQALLEAEQRGDISWQ